MDTVLFVGNYTVGRYGKIQNCQFSTETGLISMAGKHSSVDNPSFLALHPYAPILYAISEVEKGELAAYHISFKVEPTLPILNLLNRQPVQAAGPCHVQLTPQADYATVANYGGQSISLFPIAKNGEVRPASHVVEHLGGSEVVVERQMESHPHSTIIDATGNFVFVPDLGLDRIFIYKIDRTARKLEPNPAQSFIDLPPGSGPRHFNIHPNSRYAYVINELSSTITAYNINTQLATLEPIATVSTLPSDWHETSYCADIHVHPNGKFVYGSNRGHDSIAAFAVNEDGSLALIGHTATEGQTPRNFAIYPRGNFLLVANQDSDSITVFSIETDGQLTQLPRSTIATPKPVCLLFYR